MTSAAVRLISLVQFKGKFGDEAQPVYKAADKYCVSQKAWIDFFFSFSQNML
jgi:hypothetical protein